jgi:hypothetical protein
MRGDCSATIAARIRERFCRDRCVRDAQSETGIKLSVRCVRVSLFRHDLSFMFINENKVGFSIFGLADTLV